MTISAQRRKTVMLLLPAFVVALGSSCADDNVDAPRNPWPVGGNARAARSSTALAVTSTNPSFGDQGTTLDVHVLGSGFTTGAQAIWLLHGVVDDHIHTNSTTFISSSELVANITIAGDATLAFWDVQVMLSNGKNGVGSDCFQVTTAQILGSGTPGGDVNMYAANELGQAVGYTSSSSNVAFIYDAELGIVSLGSGQAWGLDPLGTVVVGRNSAVATAWVRQADNSWPAEPLPTLSGSAAGNASSAARAPDGTLIVGGWDSRPGAKKSDMPIPRPVLWTWSGSAWSPPQLLPIPQGSANASVYGVNGSGVAVGRLDAGSGNGIVWDNPSTFVVLDGSPSNINAAGTLIVGTGKNGTAVYWWRDAGTGAWHTVGVALPSLAGTACPGGSAREVNAAGVIVGDSCSALNDPQTIYKRQATVWVLDLSGPTPVLVGGPMLLPGLGAKTSNDESISSAAWVTESAPYQVTGGALENGTRLAVRWQLR